MSAKRDYYEVLGVARNASGDDVKKAFRKRAMQHHPDRNQGANRAKAEEAFKELNEAYEVIGDREKRQRYDQFGHAAFAQGGGGGGQGVDFGDIFGDLFGDFLGGLAGGRRGGSRAHRGNDLQYHLELEFEEAAFGTEKKVQIPREEGCAACGGTGAASSAGIETCRTCRGTGSVTVTQGFFSLRTACSRCAGRGRTIKDPCGECDARGRVERIRGLTITVPAGVDHETRMKLTGEGEPGMHGGPAGDLYVLISVKPHEVFHREGDHLVLELPVSFSQAALGAEVDVPTLRGNRKLHLPAGTQTGRIFKIRNEGIENVHGHGRGDLVVKAVVVTPTSLSAREEELLVELARLRGDKVEKPTKGFFQKLREAFE